MGISQAALELLVELKDQASSGLSSLGDTLGTVGTVAGGVALAGITALGGAILSGIGDAREANAIMAQTQSIIESTGGAAGMTAQQVADLASSLSAASGESLFPDDAIQGAENVLLKYRELGGLVPDVTKLAVDMAQRLGTDPAAAAETLGRALQLPFEAEGKLAKQGIILDDQTKALLATMKENGDTAGAQALLMDKLNQSFGGSAAAAAKADGGVAQFWDRIGEAKESLGQIFLPLLGQAMALLNDTVLPIVEQGVTLFQDFMAGISGTGEASGAVGDALKVVAPIFNDIQAAASEVFNELYTQGKPILDDLGTIALPALSAAGRILAGYWSTILRPALMETWYIFKTYLLPAIGDVVHVLSIVLPPIINTLAAVFTDVLFPAINGIVQALGWVGAKVNEVIGFFNNLGSSLSSIEIPSWLQGHSPPPLANWFGDIANSATDAQDAAGAIGFGGNVGPLPTAGAIGGASVMINSVTINVTGTADPRAAALAVRDELLALGRQNVDIFGGVA